MRRTRRKPYVVPRRSVQTRRVHFTYTTGSRHQHFVDGDLVLSHAIAVLSGMFPEGEDFFVRAVKDHRDTITDPELLSQVKGFIGQEVNHGREHREINRRLDEMGFRAGKTDRHIKRLLWVVEKLGKRVRLATTAALEHYTATIAEITLTDPEALRLLGETDMRNLLLWHALEESEHKAVAFDVYRTAGYPEWFRIAVMYFTTAIFISEIVGQTTLSQLRDKDTYNPTILVPSLWNLRRCPYLKREMWRRLLSYCRPGFHPDDWDATEIVEHWKQELFGEEGTFVDTLR
jgi:predicted metal-dependent hydrolase